MEDVEFVALHKYIKNTSTNGTILKEYLLNISRRLQTHKRTRKITLNQVRQKREKKKRGIKIGSSKQT